VCEPRSSELPVTLSLKQRTNFVCVGGGGGGGQMVETPRAAGPKGRQQGHFYFFNFCWGGGGGEGCDEWCRRPGLLSPRVGNMAIFKFVTSVRGGDQCDYSLWAPEVPTYPTVQMAVK